MSNNRAMLEVINNTVNWGIPTFRYGQSLLQEDRAIKLPTQCAIENFGSRGALFSRAIHKTIEKKTIRKLAQKLYLLLITRPWSDLCILPSCETRGMFSYSRNPEDGDSRRIKAKLGRILRRQCGVEEWFIKDHEMSVLTESIVGEIWPDFADVVQLWGNDIIDFYRTYHPDANCCMKGRCCQFVQLYAQNRDIVSLLCVSDEGDGVAKALVWELPDGRRVLDRVYHYRNNYDAGQAIIAKARSLGCEIQDEWDCRVDSDCIQMDVVVDMSRCEHLPYIDSVRYIKEIDGLSKVLLSNDNTDSITELTELCGQMINEKGRFDGRVECECCGGTTTEDDSWYMDGSLYCSECFHERFFCCDRCSETANRDSHYRVDNGGSSESWCEECREHHAFSCEQCGDCFSNLCVESHEVSGGEICIHCLENGSFSCCNDCGEWTDDSNATKVGEDVYCADCVTECCECGEVFANESRQIKDGTCEDCACVEA